MASPMVAFGQTLALACTTSGAASPLPSPSSPGASSLPSFRALPYKCSPSSISSCQSASRGSNRKSVSLPKAVCLQSRLFSRSLDANFFNGGAGARGLLVALAIASDCGFKAVGGSLGAQMNIFERVTRIFRSYANAIISAAEDPEKLLDQTVLEMNEDLTKLRQATAQVLASQKLLENKYKAAKQTSDDWYRRAKLALEKGDENLAREALKRKKDYEDNANALNVQLEQQKGVVEKLVSNTRLLESKMQEAKSKKDTLKARAQSAKTSQKVNEMLGNINTSSALAAFEKMEEKVASLEAEADALTQLSTDDLAGKFALLESSNVDDDLSALKREMLGSSKMPGELPAGRSSVSSASNSPSSAYPFRDVEVEKELNELRRKTREF